MKTEQVAINTIRENNENPRLIKDNKFYKLVESIKQFPKMLEVRPIVIDEDGVILGGNMRFKALLHLKHKKVNVVKIEGLTPKQKKEFIIKDNVGFGQWDWDILSNEWESKELNEWGLDIGVAKATQKFYESGKQKVEKALRTYQKYFEGKNIMQDDFSSLLDTYYIDIKL